LEFFLTSDVVALAGGSFLVSLGTVGLILRVSHRMAWYDRLSDRKVHTGNIPRLGGLGFAFSFMVFFVVIGLHSGEFRHGLRLIPVVAAMLLVLGSGVQDDFRSMSPYYKLGFQLTAALCVMVSGYGFRRVFFLESLDFLGFPGWELLRYPLTLLWIVGITNAINFIDGVDGLAGGISLLVALSFGAIFLSQGAGGTPPLLCICLAAAILGFLVFNLPLPRARIFMGDGGAYFLGFTLALFPLMETGSPAFRLPIPYAAALLMIPFLDTTAAVWRRVRDGRRIDSPDRAHTHHKLMNLGCSSRRINLILYGLQLCLSGLVYVSIQIPGWGSLVVLAGAYVAGTGFFTAIHFLNRRRLKQEALKPANREGAAAPPDAHMDRTAGGARDSL
jgi:UDP-GlcNAc:undecaprenyl-phosphate GlcNAc-1-phosphate transferase